MNKEPIELETVPHTFIEELFSRLEVRVAIKAGIAAMISLFVGVNFSSLLDRPDYLLSGSWCVFSTFVVLQAHLGGTYHAAWVRFLGVLIGSFMGGLFTSIFGSNALTLGISVVLTVLTCSFFQIKDSVRIACFSVSIVMILWGLHPEMSPWLFGLYRFLDSSLGIIIAVIVSHAIWPAQATMRLRFNIAKALRQINRLFRLELSPKAGTKQYSRIRTKLIADIAQLLNETRHYLKESQLELLTKSRSVEEWEILIDHLTNIFESTTKLSSFHTYNIDRILDEKLQERLRETTLACSKAFSALHDMFQNREVTDSFQLLPKATSDLEEELTRFRMTKATRKYEREEVEHFFVFFYNLRSIIEELLKMEEKILFLNSQPV